MVDGEIKRVLMTTDTVGGVWTFTLELARGMAAYGVEVVLAASGGQPSAEQLAAAAAVPGLCLLGSDFKLEWMDNPWRDVEASSIWLTELQAEYSPDLVHLNSFGHGSVPWRVPVVLTAHSCVVSWWKAVRGEDAPETWNRYRAEVAHALRSADVVTAPSEAMGQTLRENYGVSSAKLRTIHNGLGTNGFVRGEKQPFVFSAGRLWDDAKNVSALARIAPELPWPVYLAGDCGSTSPPNCVLLGKLNSEQMADWYSRASVYALPARYEPFGLSVLEAALSGCALVLGDIESLREIWEDAALFVPPDDDKALHKAIEELIANLSLREKMAQRSFRRALTFDTARTTRQYMDLYQSLVPRQSRQCVS